MVAKHFVLLIKVIVPLSGMDNGSKNRIIILVV